MGQATACSTNDPNLAACIMAVGVPLCPGDEISFVTGDAQLVEFNFLPRSEEGITFEQCIDAWNRGAEFIQENPHHAMSYAMCTIGNRRHLDQYLRKAKPKVYIKKGKSIALIDPNSSQETQDHILGKLGGN